MVITAETVSVDILGRKAGSYQFCILSNSSLRNAAGNGGKHPAGDTEEVEHILQEHDHNDARCALCKTGNRLHEDLHHGKHIDLCNIGEQIGNGQADEDGRDVVEPVLNKVGDHTVLTKEGILGQQLVDDSHHQTDHHSSEHTACAELVHGNQRAAVHRLKVHAHHVGTDAGKACDHGAVFLFDLLQTVVGDHEYHEQTNQTKREGAQRADVRQHRNKAAEDGPQGRDGTDHRERNNEQDRIRHDAEPEVRRDLVNDRNEMFLDPRLNLLHHSFFLPFQPSS